jgi:hypothetical protein
MIGFNRPEAVFDATPKRSFGYYSSFWRMKVLSGQLFPSQAKIYYVSQWPTSRVHENFSDANSNDKFRNRISALAHEIYA